MAPGVEHRASGGEAERRQCPPAATQQRLDAEVRDLKQGVEAIEERARYELGMIKEDEVFFQVVAASSEPPKR